MTSCKVKKIRAQNRLWQGRAKGSGGGQQTVQGQERGGYSGLFKVVIWGGYSEETVQGRGGREDKWDDC